MPPDVRARLDPLDACTAGEAGATSTGTAICAGQGTRDADRRITALISEAGATRPAIRGHDLASAQQHWRAYRDLLHCGLFDPGRGGAGTQTPADIELCRFEITLRREAELRWLIHAMGPR